MSAVDPRLAFDPRPDFGPGPDYKTDDDRLDPVDYADLETPIVNRPVKR